MMTDDESLRNPCDVTTFAGGLLSSEEHGWRSASVLGMLWWTSFHAQRILHLAEVIFGNKKALGRSHISVSICFMAWNSGDKLNSKRMNETGPRPGTGMTSPRHSTHQAVMDRLRQRFSQYRKHHYDCQSKYAQSLPAVQDLERQEASNLHKRALECRNRMMNMNGKASKQNDGEGKVEQQQQIPNGLEKSTNAIFQIREVCFLCCTKGFFV